MSDFNSPEEEDAAIDDLFDRSEWPPAPEEVDVTAPAFILSEDQEKAKNMFINFLISPIEQVFVLQGYAGTGKSTLVKTLMDNMPKYLQMAKLVNPSMFDYQIQLTATTNKAAEALAQITGMEVRTIHSFLGLRVSKDYRTGHTELVPRSEIPEFGYILIIDEASMIDSKLLTTIFKKTQNCKIMFIGDPAQLPPVKYNNTPVFDAGFTTAKLEKVMRQAEGNPIITLATQFRNTVSSGQWFNFKPDGHHIVHLPRSDFEDRIIDEFTRNDWRYNDSKILGWTNKCVIDYNHAVNNHISGDPHFAVGDYVVCNKHVIVGKHSIKTDQLVYITCIEPDVEYHDVVGNWVTVDYSIRAFFPKSLAAKNERVKRAKALNEYRLLAEIEECWFDLRAAFAQTINKSQGSTYDKVFIDLDDVSRCNLGDLIARLMYVAVSRARHYIYLVGDFA
jgi:hypothetical protein